MKWRKALLYISAVCTLTGAVSCNDSEDVLPDFGTKCYKRSVSPNIVGQNIYFAFAMAVQPTRGILTGMDVYTTIPGAIGTYIDPNAYYTKDAVDIPVLVAGQSVLDGNICRTQFVRDTCAATLRYYYCIPEEARGKEVKFRFTAHNSLNEQQIIEMGPYKISKMDMKLNIKLDAQNPFLSVKTMQSYSATQLEENPVLAEMIDLVYVYNPDNAQIVHSLLSPEAVREVAPDMQLPTSLQNRTQLIRTWNLQDQQLSNLQWAIFVDDLDFEKITFDRAQNMQLDLLEEAGCWILTSSSPQYKGYLYVNELDTEKEGIVVSLKNYQM